MINTRSIEVQIRRQCQMDMEHREIYILLMQLLGIIEEQQRLIDRINSQAACPSHDC